MPDACCISGPPAGRKPARGQARAPAQAELGRADGQRLAKQYSLVRNNFLLISSLGSGAISWQYTFDFQPTQFLLVIISLILCQKLRKSFFSPRPSTLRTRKLTSANFRQFLVECFWIWIDCYKSLDKPSKTVQRLSKKVGPDFRNS